MRCAKEVRYAIVVVRTNRCTKVVGAGCTAAEVVVDSATVTELVACTGIAERVVCTGYGHTVRQVADRRVTLTCNNIDVGVSDDGVCSTGDRVGRGSSHRVRVACDVVRTGSSTDRVVTCRSSHAVCWSRHGVRRTGSQCVRTAVAAIVLLPVVAVMLLPVPPVRLFCVPAFRVLAVEAVIVLAPPVAVMLLIGAVSVFDVPAVRLFEPVVAAIALLPVVAVTELPVPPVRLFWGRSSQRVSTAICDDRVANRSCDGIATASCRYAVRRCSCGI